MYPVVRLLSQSIPYALRPLALLWLTGIMLVSLTACQGQTTTTQALPDPMTLLHKAAADIKQVKTLRFKLQLTGAPAYVDYGNTIAFVSADGVYAEPDRMQAKVVARLIGVPGEIEIVAIGARQYLKNAILTAGRWLQQDFSPGFNAQDLIQSDKGIEYGLRSVTNVKMIGQTDLYGNPVYHITGNAKAEDMNALTVGLIRGADVVADIYINVNTGRVEQVVMVQPETKTDKLDATTWTLEIFDYNAPDIKVDEPAVAAITATPGFLPLITPLPPPTTSVTTAEATQ